MLTKDIILVEWRDSAFQPSVWEFIEDIEPLVDVHCTSVGFLLEETDEYITIALAISKTQVLGRTTIPKGCIVSWKVLTP